MIDLELAPVFYHAVVAMEKVDEDKTGKEIGFEAG